MRKMVLAAFAATTLCGSAQAVDFNYTFTGSAQFPGTVTGTIFDLTDNTTSAASRVSAAASSGSGNVFASVVATIVANSFTISNGQITAYSFQAQRDDFLPGATLTSNLFLNSSGTTAFRQNTGFVVNTNVTAAMPLSVTFTRVGATAVLPEPSSWAMMIAGFGFVGAAMRRRKVAVSFA